MSSLFRLLLSVAALSFTMFVGASGLLTRHPTDWEYHITTVAVTILGPLNQEEVFESLRRLDPHSNTSTYQCANRNLKLVAVNLRQNIDTAANNEVSFQLGITFKSLPSNLTEKKERLETTDSRFPLQQLEKDVLDCVQQALPRSAASANVSSDSLYKAHITASPILIPHQEISERIDPSPHSPMQKRHLRNERRQTTAETTSSSFFNSTDLGRRYFNAEELYSRLLRLESLYPGLFAVLDLEGDTLYESYEKKKMTVVRLSTNPRLNDPTKPEFVLVGTHHAREWIAPEVTVGLLEVLCESYVTNARVRRLLQQVEVIAMPLVNPDGFSFTFLKHPICPDTDCRFWRKNRRPIENNGRVDVGVDLNRNYPYAWGAPGASASPSSEVYRGPSAASEIEVQHVQRLLQNSKLVSNLAYFVSYHSYGQEVLYPFGHSASVFSPVHKTMKGLFETAGSVMQAGGFWGSSYVVRKASYQAIISGDTVDWVHDTFQNVPALTIELRPDMVGCCGFVLPVDQINATVWENLGLLVYVMDYHVASCRAKSVESQSNTVNLNYQWWREPSAVTSDVGVFNTTLVNMDEDHDGVVDYADPCVSPVLPFGVGSTQRYQQASGLSGIGPATPSSWWYGAPFKDYNNNSIRRPAGCVTADPPSVYGGWNSTTSVVLSLFVNLETNIYTRSDWDWVNSKTCSYVFQGTSTVTNGSSLNSSSSVNVTSNNYSALLLDSLRKSLQSVVWKEDNSSLMEASLQGTQLLAMTPAVITRTVAEKFPTIGAQHFASQASTVNELKVCSLQFVFSAQTSMAWKLDTSAAVDAVYRRMVYTVIKLHSLSWIGLIDARFDPVTPRATSDSADEQSFLFASNGRPIFAGGTASPQDELKHQRIIAQSSAPLQHAGIVFAAILFLIIFFQ